MYEPYVRLVEKLAEITPGNFLKKTVLVNSCAEAVENATKVAGHYTKRKSVITFEHAFHGRTLLGMTLTSRIKPYEFGFGPFAPEVHCMRLCLFYLSFYHQTRLRLLPLLHLKVLAHPLQLLHFLQRILVAPKRYGLFALRRG